MPFVNILVKQPKHGQTCLFKYNHDSKPYFSEEVYEGLMWYNEKTEWYDESPDPDKAAALEYLESEIARLRGTPDDSGTCKILAFKFEVVRDLLIGVRQK